ncbi:hypothetical protein KKQ91_04105 [Clostridioides difficile]|nr:hypothetical protein [Clostridioides difficile]
MEKYLYIVDMMSVKNSNFLIDYGNIVENKLFFDIIVAGEILREEV